jgi:hypothetical protein
MIQVKIFEGTKEEIQENINAFLQLSNIEYIDFKIFSETKIMLVYELFELHSVKKNDIVVHIGANNKLNNKLDNTWNNTTNKSNENSTN